ncbi:3-isopropylmalate dehydratase small subunit [Achromobacter sp.]|uniref:3-isopropylmalate dehydratase small subunit n=1 Tax=Achromobacter sp. TaxID=134375 RepID=UPI003C758146
MKPFLQAHGIILPMNQDHVDTDAIVPQRWLVTIERSGLADGFMGGLRYDEHGQPRPDCVLNQAGYQGAAIVLARENYGCGSSREHAVWAHQEYGIRAIVAASYGPIFHENCLKNGLLPVTLPIDAIDTLMEQALGRPGSSCTVDLASQRVTGPDGTDYAFDIDAGRRQLLLDGTDDIDLALQRTAEIDAFQQRQQRTQPWLT